MSPRSVRNAAASAASSCPISSSIFAQTATAAVARAREERRESGGLGGAVDPCRRITAAGEVRFVEVDDDQQRLGGEKLEPAQPLELFALEIQRAQRAAVFERRLADHQHVALAFEIRRPAPSSGLSRAVQGAAPPRRGRRESARPPSPARRAPDRSIRTGARQPDRETRAARGQARRRSCTPRHRRAPWRRRCAPVAARSVNSTVAGTRFLGLYIAVRRSRRASGTFEMPTDVSPLPWAARAVSRALVMS